MNAVRGRDDQAVADDLAVQDRAARADIELDAVFGAVTNGGMTRDDLTVSHLDICAADVTAAVFHRGVIQLRHSISAAAVDDDTAPAARRWCLGREGDRL